MCISLLCLQELPVRVVAAACLEAGVGADLGAGFTIQLADKPYTVGT